LSSEISRAISRENQIVDLISEEETSRVNAISLINSSLIKEINDRNIAIDVVSSNLTKEINDRKTAIDVVNSSLNKEISDRETAINTVNASILQETNERKTAIDTVNASILQEINERRSQDDLKVNKAGDVMSGMLTANAGVKITIGNNSYLYIGDHWRINALLDGSSLIFEYSEDTQNWTSAVPFIMGM